MHKRKISGCLWKACVSGKKKAGAKAHRAERIVGGTMKKTMEQIILEGQVAKCRSLEELYVLWELMQQMEEDPDGKTCYPELDQRNFHIDGIVDPVHYDGTLYILKETNMRKMIQKGETMPVVSDIRGDFLSGKSPSGRVEYLEYLTGMQKVLWEERHPGEECRLTGKKLREKAAVLYLNKRGGKGAADEVSLDYGQYYMEFIKKQIRLLNPKIVVCCGEDLFRLIVMEVFQNKKQKKNREIYMKWKDLIQGDVFFAGREYRPIKEAKKDEAAVRVVRMWNPSYRVNNGQYVSLEEYLKEFRRRLSGGKEDEQENLQSAEPDEENTESPMTEDPAVEKSE